MSDLTVLCCHLAAQFYLSIEASEQGLPMAVRTGNPIKIALEKADTLIALAARTPGPKVDVSGPQS